MAIKRDRRFWRPDSVGISTARERHRRCVPDPGRPAIAIRFWAAGALRFKIAFALAKNAFDTRYADLAQSTPYSRLTPRNIGQRYAMFSCPINYLCANAMPPTNQGVGSSNLSGRAILLWVHSGQIGNRLFRRHGYLRARNGLLPMCRSAHVVTPNT